MERNARKVQVISDFYGLRSTHPGNVIMELLDIMIEEFREENDTISPDLLPRSQGKITMCFQLKSYLLRGLPKRPGSFDPREALQRESKNILT